jgi:surface polysaccharide O-acyltransferase-like enzyme
MGKTARLSNFELLRIIAMAMIVLLHCNNWMIGNVAAQDVTDNPYGSFWRILAQQICIVGANVFVMISGWFGIKPKVKGGGYFFIPDNIP